ncbi:copper chaperone PCu(A)C [Streptomyces griseorubiginosus]|uniref:copper chaperone PCu(A)C n=1 Tax=Streptomyces griseorubiginosus TaxID=67304 RepID=UPI0011408A08|nr:copper chaperone PCu(A)C [Streptomyces griseorubiginosus]
MSSSLRRGALAAASLAFSIVTLSACAAGTDAQTLQVKPDNAETSVGAIKLQNIVVITQATTEASGETKGPAAVSGTVFNTGATAQTLDSVTIPGGGSAEIKPAKGNGKVTVPAHGSVVLGGKGNASAAVAELGESVKDGNAQKVTFTFSTTGDVSVQAFVVPADSYYAKWGPSAAPSAPATPAKPTPSGSATPSGAATPSGSATPTDAASASATAG